MYTKNTTITNDTGLHARPASDFVRLATQYDSKIYIGKAENDVKLDAKSIVMILALALKKGTVVEISADGSDEKQAVDALIGLIESGFPEDD